MLKNSENNLIFSKNVRMDTEFNRYIEVIYKRPDSHYNFTKKKRNEILVYIIENDIKKPPTAKEDFKWSTAFRVKVGSIDPNDAEDWYSKNIDNFKEIWRTHHEGYKLLSDSPRNDFHTNFKSTCLRFIKNDMRHLKGSKLGDGVFMANWSLIELAKKYKGIEEENKEYLSDYRELEAEHEKITKKLNEEVKKLKERCSKNQEREESMNYVDKDLYEKELKHRLRLQEQLKENSKTHSFEINHLKERLKIAEDETNSFIDDGYKPRKKRDKVEDTEEE